MLSFKEEAAQMDRLIGDFHKQETRESYPVIVAPYSLELIGGSGRGHIGAKVHGFEFNPYFGIEVRRDIDATWSFELRIPNLYRNNGYDRLSVAMVNLSNAINSLYREAVRLESSTGRLEECFQIEMKAHLDHWAEHERKKKEAELEQERKFIADLGMGDEDAKALVESAVNATSLRDFYFVDRRGSGKLAFGVVKSYDRVSFRFQSKTLSKRKMIEIISWHGKKGARLVCDDKEIAWQQ